MSTGRWRQWHKILGLWLGILLLLIAVSGGVLVFKENLIALNLPATTKSSEGPADYSIDRLSGGLQQLLQQHSIESIYYIKTPTQGRQYWWLATRSDDIFLYDVNGAPVVDHWRMLPILHWLAEFHTELLFHDGGTALLTLLAFSFLILILAGLISWWPGRRGFRVRHLWAWPARRGPALRQHRAVAIFCVPLLLLSLVTGVGMSVQSALGFFTTTTPRETIAQPAAVATVSPVLASSKLNVLLRSAQRYLPHSQITMLSLPTAAKPRLGLRFRAADEWHVNGKTNMTIDVASGAIQIKDIKTASVGRKILNTFYPLHSSYGLPSLYKTMVAVTAVLTVLLGLLGLLAWLRRRGGLLN